MKRSLRALLLIILVLGLVAAGVASMWLGRGVKIAIERFAPGILGAPVSIGAVVLAPWSGRGAITNLVIGNPPGFKGAHALKVGSVEVQIKLSSLVTDMVVVESVNVREPEILYELSSNGSNLARLQRNAERGKGNPGAAQGGKSLLIRKLAIEGGQIAISETALSATAVKLSLPAIQMSNLGGKGRAPADAVVEVLSALGGSVGKVVSVKALRAGASDVMGRLDGLFKRKK